MKIQELYHAYAEMERIPIDARSADEAAARRRSEKLTSLDERIAQSKRASESSKEKLLADLRIEAQEASSQGAIPHQNAVVSGLTPNFARVRSLREKLEGLITEKARAGKELDRLRSRLRDVEMQVEEERRSGGLRVQARRADLITFLLGAITVALSVASGSGLTGTSILAIGLGLVGLRLFRGRSAMMLLALQKRPALETVRKVRLGYVLSVCGWVGVISLTLGFAVTALVNASGVNLTLGSMTRQGLDSYWFLGLAGALLAVFVGHRALRGTR